MTPTNLLECSFYIPSKRDVNLSDGLLHDLELWEFFDNEMYLRFEGGTADPNLYRGFYKDPDTGERVDDESYRFVVTLPENEIDALRKMLREACGWFQQKCIYLSIVGKVEFVTPEAHETS